MSAPEKILIVDDEEDILELLRYNLNKEGYEIHITQDPEEGIKIAKEILPDLIILDIMMPNMDGIEVCGILREEESLADTLIAFLTARNESFTQITALESGGDDYIQKPIKINVLKSRIKALLRRSKKNIEAKNGSVQTFGELKIDYDQLKVITADKEINLAKKEFELLTLLCSKPGKVFRRKEILNSVWGSDVIVGDRTIDVHIRKLREKIGHHYIVTYKGIGYKFEL